MNKMNFDVIRDLNGSYRCEARNAALGAVGKTFEDMYALAVQAAREYFLTLSVPPETIHVSFEEVLLLS